MNSPVRNLLLERLPRFVVALAAAGILALGAFGAHGAQKVLPITMLINQSPWFDGFQRLVELYEKETGNKIELDVTPYVGVLEKMRNSVRAPKGTYDLVNVTHFWLGELYDGGFLTPIHEIDPSFKLDKEVVTYDDTIFWDAKKNTFDSKTGILMGLPINGNVQVLYYRADLYKKHGLKLPETWAELLANARKLHNPPRVYGMVQRGDRTAITFNFGPYMFSHGGSVFADPKGGDYTIVLNSPANRKAIDFYVELGKQAGHPSVASMTQGKMIQLIATGKAAHAIGVIAAWGQLDNPDKSAVVGKINAALIPRSADGPHATSIGHWVGGIPSNISKQRQRAAMEFLKWFLTYENQVKYTEFGAVPVRADLLRSDLVKQHKFRFLEAFSENSKWGVNILPVKEGAQINAIMDLRLNQVLTGELSSIGALNKAAREIHDIMRKAGYKTGRIADLK